MLCLAFKAGGGRFALPARGVAEVTPLVRLCPSPGAPQALAGIMNHRGEPLPVADATMLIMGKASRPWASTRILVLALPSGRRLGLMAERVLRTVDIDPASVRPPDAACAPYVTGLAAWGDGVLQLLDPSRLPLEDLFPEQAP